MKNIKRFNLLLLFSLVSVCLFSFALNIKVEAVNGVVENDGATYRVAKTVEKCDLGYGVHYQRDMAYTTVKTGHYSGPVAGYGSSGNMVPGQEYQQQVNWLEIEAGSEVELIPYASLHGGDWNKMSVRKAAEEFEENNPGYMIVAAVNGDWFQIQSEVPASSGVTISNGEYYKATSTHSGGGKNNTLLIDNDAEGKRLKEIYDSEVVPTLTIYDANGTELQKININKVNEEPSNGEVSLFYAMAKTSYSSRLVPITVSNAWVASNPDKAVTSLPNSFYGKGNINLQSGTTELAKGKFAIKTNNSSIDSLLTENVTVRVQYEYANEELKDAKNVIGFPYEVMYDGVPVYSKDSGKEGDGKTRKPRTIMGQKEDGTLIFATVDGRQASKNMYGLTQMEMGALVEYYGCVDAWKFDGGGSATMIIRKKSGFQISASFNDSSASDWHVVNSPSDGNERNDGNCLLIAVKAPELTFEIKELTDDFVVFNVALITLLDKYNDIYVMINGEKYKVIDNEVKITGLKGGIDYEAFVYGEDIDNKYLNDLGEKINFKLALPKPTGIAMNFDMKEKDGQKLIQIYYRVKNGTAVKKIEFALNDSKVTTYTGNVYIEQSMDLYSLINNIKVDIVIVTSEFNGEEIVNFNEIEKNFTTMFIFDELDFTVDKAMNDIFS